ncbi:ABC transporter permease [Streptomyces sp. MNP-20]|uniref:ABC transporter permease n=1 Tax=Streptomyces sp. MNP-20 TaxID=2721165 RepID=UPI001553BE97|nr:ABC transporter permease [Streptomyces sp. MNP-20]
MLRIYAIELRRSPLLLALPLLVVVDLLVLFGRSRYWIGVWPEASAAAQVVTLFLGPALAAVSAWQAGRGSRSGMPELVLASARPSWHAEAARFAATLTLGCVAYGVGCLTAAAVSLKDAGPGFLWPSYLLLGFASLTLFAALGHIVGRVWPSAAFTPAVCALGGFVAYVGVGQGYGLYVLSGGPNYMIDATVLSQRLLLALALSCVAIFFNRIPRTHRKIAAYAPVKTRVLMAGSMLLAFALVPLIAVSGPVRVTRPATVVEPLCDRAGDRSAEVCVWPEHRKYLPELIAMADRLARIPQGWIKQPAAFYEFGLRPTRLGDPGFDIAEGHVRPAAISMAAQVSTQSLGCTPPRDAPRAWEASNRLDLWLEYRAMGTDPKAADAGLNMVGVAQEQRAAGQAVTLTEAQQEAWAARQRARMKKAGCEG